MRLIRWVEGRISGRKNRSKDGSTTSADDQFVYHPSPYRQPHTATPAHNPPTKLHHQLEQRLNEQIKQRLSVHFGNIQQMTPKSQSSGTDSVKLRRTTSALESRQRKPLIDRTTDYTVIDRRHTQYETQYDSQSKHQCNNQLHAQIFDPYSLPSDLNVFDANSRHATGNQSSYNTENECTAESENEIQHLKKQFNLNRYSSITYASNESAFFDCSSPSLANQNCYNPSLSKKRTRIKTNPWLPSPWMPSNSITNKLKNDENNGNLEQSNEFRNQYQLNDNIESMMQKSGNRSNDRTTTNDLNYSNNYITETSNSNVRSTSVRASFSFASTLSSDSGCCNVNTSSMDASVLSANNLMNESLISCSLITNNSLIDDDEEILTISHGDEGEHVVHQMNARHHFQRQLNCLPSRSLSNDHHYQFDDKEDSIPTQIMPQSSTLDDFGEMSSRAESQLSAIYQQIDELKSKIDEIDLDNGSSEEEIATSSSSYSPVSSSSLASSPTSIPNTSTYNTINDSILDELSISQKNKTQQRPLTNDQPTSPTWSLASICSAQNVDLSSLSIRTRERNSLNIFTIDESRMNTSMTDSIRSDNSEPHVRLYSYLKLDNPQMKYRNVANLQKLLLNSSGRRRSLNGKLLNLNNSSNFKRLSNSSLKSGCNEAWVSTTTDLLVSSDDEETLNYVDHVNNQIKLKKYGDQTSKSESVYTIHNQQSAMRHRSSDLIKSESVSHHITKLMHPLNSTGYNFERDAFKFRNRENEINDRKQCKSQIPKPLTPIKVNDSYKRLRPTNGSKIPAMKPIVENEFDSPSHLNDQINELPNLLPSDHSLTNRIDSMHKVRNLPKPKTFLFNNKKTNHNDLYLVSPLTQQLKFEKQQKQDQRKLDCSFKKTELKNEPQTSKSSIYKHHRSNNINPLSPPASSDSGIEFTPSEDSHSDHSPLAEQSKNHKLVHRIQNLRSELRDVIKVAIDEVKKDSLF